MRTLMLVPMAMALTLGTAAKGDPVVTTPPSPISGGAYYYPGIFGAAGSHDASVDLNGDRGMDLTGSVLAYIEMGRVNGADVYLQPLTGVDLVQEATAGTPGAVVAALGPDTVIGPASAWCH